MSTFNKVKRTGVTSPITSTNEVVLTGNGAPALARTAKSELFLLAVSYFAGKDTFYEDAKDRDNRFVKLSQEVAVADGKWFVQFVSWLRNKAFMRSASVVAAVEGAKALHDRLDGYIQHSGPRELIAASMARADEPGEVLAYYESKYGKNFPSFLKKGVADGAKRLYNEYSLLKYDTDSKGYRFADVIQLTHPAADSDKQNALFKYALDRRYSNVEKAPSLLFTLVAREGLMSLSVPQRRAVLTANAGPQILKDAGMTWEAVSGWLQGPMDAEAWEAIIPSMGYMALLRNLRNFREAGISAASMKSVLAKLSDENEVKKSKQFPFRFLAAYQANKDNLKIAGALEEALEYSLDNVPSLPGKTLILVDRSGSMTWSNDDKMGLTFADQAAIFGSAIALRAENATLVQFGTGSSEVKFHKGDSVLPMLKKFTDMGGTDTAEAVKRHFAGHDRVVIVTDEQYNYGYRYNDPSDAIPASTPLYTWNLEGYKAGGFSGSQKRHTWGGLTDAAFKMIPLTEAGISCNWPWES